MGLSIDNINYKNMLNDISYRFNRARITGIYGNNANLILDIINGDNDDYDGEIIFEKVPVNKGFYMHNPTSIALIETYPFFYSTKVEDEFKFNLTFRKCDVEDIENKEKKVLKLVGLEEDIIKRDINTLSTSDKYLLSIAINLIYEPEIILFKDIFSGLDHVSKKRITTLINNLKEDKKIIIVTSRDTNILYELTDEVILLNGSKIYKDGTTDKLFTSVELMKDGVIPMPNITKVTYLAKTNKKAKLSYHKDVRDIIKDIYKHV